MKITYLFKKNPFWGENSIKTSVDLPILKIQYFYRKIRKCGTTAVMWEILSLHLKHRQAKARCGSLSSASVDDTTNRATCFTGCHNLSHWLLVDQSEASPRNAPPQAQHGRNMARLAETEAHSLVWGTAHRGTLKMLPRASACFYPQTLRRTRKCTILVQWFTRIYNAKNRTLMIGAAVYNAVNGKCTNFWQLTYYVVLKRQITINLSSMPPKIRNTLKKDLNKSYTIWNNFYLKFFKM